jgi:hypothetical protein
VWRYLTLSAVIATIKTRQLRLTRVDRFQDPFEGSVPKTQIEAQIPLLIGAASRRAMMNCVAAHYPGMAKSMPPDEDLWIRITRLRRARTRSAHASCWSAGDESEALWANDSEQYLRAREAEAMCDHVWIFEARTLAMPRIHALKH